MADKDLKDLLDGLFSDLPIEAAPAPDSSRDHVPGQRDELLARAVESITDAVIITERQVPELEQTDLLTTLGRRNAQLQAAAQVSHAVSSILNLDDLLPQAVDLIRTHLNLYYAGIFLVDESGEWSGEAGKWAVLRSGSGEAGRQMMTSGHKLEIGGTSMIGWCIANRKARISLRVGEEAMRFANPLLPETRSEMALPLISHNQVIGAMTIQDTDEAAFSQDDISILQTMADQLANAIENARLFQESGRQITELAVVNEISQAISSAFQLDELMETVHQQVNRLFDTTNFFIATYQEGDDKWQSTFHLEDGRRQAPAWYGIKAGLTGHIIRSRQPLLFRSIQEIIAFHQSQGASVIGETAHSWLGVPLVSGDKVVGVMAVQDYTHEYLYSDQDLALFLTIAAQVAVALDSLRLLQETRRRAQELEVINRIGGAITSILDLDEVLYQIADTIKTHFKCYFVGISLLEEDRLVFHGGSTIGDSDAQLGLVGFDLGRGPSLIAQAARTGQPVLVNDVLADSRYLPLDELPDTRSELDLPIEVKGQVIGVLDVQSDQPDAFSPADVELLQSLANQAGIAIDNAHLIHETQARADREHALRQVSEAIGTAENLIESLPAVAQHLRALVPLDRLTVATYTAGDPECFISCVDVQVDDSHTYSARLIQTGAALPLKGSATGWVITHGELRMDQDIRREMLFAEDKQLIADGLISRLILPLRIGEQIVGTLNLSGAQPDTFSQEHLPVLLQVAGQIALTLERARLLEETRAALAQAEAVYKRYLSQEWQNYLSSSNRACAYQDSSTKLVAAEDVWTPEIERAINEGCTVTWQETGDDERASRSALALPIRLGGQTIGVLDFYQEGQTREWTDDEKALVEALADQIALALENARLFEQIERRARREAMIGQIVAQVRRQPDIDSIMQTAVRELGKALGAPRTFIQLTSPLEALVGSQSEEPPREMSDDGN